jgi:uncharacterized protein with PIN domain
MLYPVLCARCDTEVDRASAEAMRQLWVAGVYSTRCPTCGHEVGGRGGGWKSAAWDRMLNGGQEDTR